MKRANRKPLTVGAVEAASTDNATVRDAMRERCKRREIYSFEHEGRAFHFNVSLAWHLLLVYPRLAEEFSPAEHGVDLAHVKSRYPGLDVDYASTCDTTLPLLFVPFNGQRQLIDGWHRMARALMEEEEEGCATLAAYLLTEAEAEVIRVRVPERKEADVP